MHKALRRKFCLPGLAFSCYHTIKAGAPCAKERVVVQASSTPLKLFPPSGPLEDVSIELLTKLIPSGRGHTNILVINDHFTKIARAIPLKGTNAFQIAQAFVKHWAFVYGIPRTMLTDNGPHYIAKYLLQIHRVICVNHHFTTTNHQTANRQTERYNRTLLAVFHRFIADHPEDWYLYADTVPYAYKNQVHSVTESTSMELVFSPVLPHLALEEYNPPTGVAKSTRDRWLAKLEEHIRLVRQTLQMYSSDTSAILTAGSVVTEKR